MIWKVETLALGCTGTSNKKLWMRCIMVSINMLQPLLSCLGGSVAPYSFTFKSSDAGENQYSDSLVSSAILGKKIPHKKNWNFWLYCVPQSQFCGFHTNFTSQLFLLLFRGIDQHKTCREYRTVIVIVPNKIKYLKLE